MKQGDFALRPLLSFACFIQALNYFYERLTEQ